jgi:hypothetical protein
MPDTQEFVIERISVKLTNERTKAHIGCRCRGSKIHLVMNRVNLERLRLAIHKMLNRMPSALDESD